MTNVFRYARWWGMAAGLALAAMDTATLAWLGLRFDMNGHEVTWLVLAFFGSSFGLPGCILVTIHRHLREEVPAAASRLDAGDRRASVPTAHSAVALFDMRSHDGIGFCNCANAHIRQQTPNRGRTTGRVAALQGGGVSSAGPPDPRSHRGVSAER
jgi:hypothetical protein